MNRPHIVTVTLGGFGPSQLHLLYNFDTFHAIISTVPTSLLGAIFCAIGVYQKNKVNRKIV